MEYNHKLDVNIDLYNSFLFILVPFNNVPCMKSVTSCNMIKVLKVIDRCLFEYGRLNGNECLIKDL